MKNLSLVAGLLVGMAFLGGCKSSSTSSNSGSGSTSSTSTSQSYTCCINGTNYSCPSQDAVSKCGSGDSSACTQTGTNPSGSCN
jgi:hypothetical protein